MLRQAKTTNFAKEIEEIKQNGHVSKSSRLAKLCPVFDNGLLVIGGHLKHVSVPEGTKHPVILPRHHRLSEMIYQEYHDGAHVGTEWVLSKVRHHFWIINARALIKRIRRACIICKKLYSAPCIQRMVDLPPQRCQPGQHPLTTVEVDLFGPFNIVQGRSTIKRYGCVYTCFSTQAIHLEVLSNMETDAFINGLVRFVARRGHPSHVWSDNGTNLVGAQAELSRSFSQLNGDKV